MPYHPARKCYPLIRLLRRILLRNKFLSLKCAPELGGVHKYFFLKKKVDLRSECVLEWHHSSQKVTPLQQIFRSRVGWHLAANSFHHHARLVWEISPHTLFFGEKIVRSDTRICVIVKSFFCHISRKRRVTRFGRCRDGMVPIDRHRRAAI